MTETFGTQIPSPVGLIKLFATDEGLRAVHFPRHRHAQTIECRVMPTHPVLRLAAAELSAYFSGQRFTFATPLAPEGTRFQRDVWLALRTIPVGETQTYSQLATQIGRPKAVRAVGAANGRNPLSIFVPCHRVIGADGTLTGYAGGLEAKQWLLDHERQAGSQMTTGISRSVQD
jgi:methylated-DNA-[protein]-cysteine S-methyltransferase